MSLGGDFNCGVIDWTRLLMSLCVFGKAQKTEPWIPFNRHSSGALPLSGGEYPDKTRTDPGYPSN